jgi:nucleoid DNA-binding protein
MTYNELVNRVSKKLGITLAESEVYLDCLLDIIKRAMAVGDEVKLEHFGKLVSHLRRKQVHRRTKKELTDTLIDVEFHQYYRNKLELVELSSIRDRIEKEIDYVIDEKDLAGGPAQQRVAGSGATKVSENW